MTNRQQNAKRLAIYLLIVFAVSLTLILFHKFIYTSRTAFFFVQQSFCWSPAIACIITRAVTKEGFRDMKLHLRLQGNLRYYLLAFALPLIFVPAMEILPLILSGHREWLGSFTWANTASAILQLISTAIVGSIGLLGEELGWRAYMNQKMEPLLGTFAACLAGGMIWGLWHFPNDIQNYLNGYGSFSRVLQNGFERMLMLILLGTILMWLTKKTDSVWPAVILHMMHNCTIGIIDHMLLLSGMPENYEPHGREKIITYICEYPPLFLLAVLFMALLLRDSKRQNKIE